MAALTSDEVAAVSKAKELTAKIDAIHQQIDGLLEPIAKKAMALDVDQLNEIACLLPSGFYRTELRTILSKRK